MYCIVWIYVRWAERQRRHSIITQITHGKCGSYRRLDQLRKVRGRDGSGTGHVVPSGLAGAAQLRELKSKKLWEYPFIFTQPYDIPHISYMASRPWSASYPAYSSRKNFCFDGRFKRHALPPGFAETASWKLLSAVAAGTQPHLITQISTVGAVVNPCHLSQGTYKKFIIGYQNTVRHLKYRQFAVSYFVKFMQYWVYNSLRLGLPERRQGLSPVEHRPGPSVVIWVMTMVEYKSYISPRTWSWQQLAAEITKISILHCGQLAYTFVIWLQRRRSLIFFFRALTL
jgi:hypothetical protein